MAAIRSIRPVPVHILWDQFRGRWPTIIALHLDRASTLIIAAATVMSIAFALVLVRGAASFLPPGLVGDPERRASMPAVHSA
jgi:hypothetical protein